MGRGLMNEESLTKHALELLDIEDLAVSMIKSDFIVTEISRSMEPTGIHHSTGREYFNEQTLEVAIVLDDGTEITIKKVKKVDCRWKR